MSAARYAVVLAGLLIAGTAASAPAAAQIYVMESTVAAVRVGSAIDMGDTLSIPAGGHIRAVLPSGKTQTIKGPYTGSVADLAKGQPVNEGVAAWIKNVLKTGGATESTAGATRSIARPPERPVPAFSWSAIPLADGSTLNGPECPRMPSVDDVAVTASFTDVNFWAKVTVSAFDPR